MLVAVVALLFFLLIALLSGTITLPTKDEILLLISSFGLLIFSWIRMRERRAEQMSPKESEKDE